jgi:hypothetical protein
MLTVVVPMLMAGNAWAHDDGHGPKLGDQPKFGGAVTAVINHKEVEAGRDAKLLYKAELTKNSSGMVRVYFYDKNMKPVELEAFTDAEGQLLYKDRKTRKGASKSFDLEKKGNHFEGKMPLKPMPPFNIDVTVKKGDRKLFMAFDNLS